MNINKVSALGPAPAALLRAHGYADGEGARDKKASKQQNTNTTKPAK